VGEALHDPLERTGLFFARVLGAGLCVWGACAWAAPLRDCSCTLSAPCCSHCLLQADTVTRCTCSASAMAFLGLPAALSHTPWARLRARKTVSSCIVFSQRARCSSVKGCPSLTIITASGRRKYATQSD